jgi:hypothetical protein
MPLVRKSEWEAKDNAKDATHHKRKLRKWIPRNRGLNSKWSIPAENSQRTNLPARISIHNKKKMASTTKAKNHGGTSGNAASAVHCEAIHASIGVKNHKRPDTATDFHAHQHAGPRDQPEQVFGWIFTSTAHAGNINDTVFSSTAHAGSIASSPQRSCGEGRSA